MGGYPETMLMASTMTAVMLLSMGGMYNQRRVNAFILGGAAVVFVLALVLVRSQATVDDIAWMKAMIPHHSIAILTSKRANITDSRVRALADSIIAAQEREITVMKILIRDLEK